MSSDAREHLVDLLQAMGVARDPQAGPGRLDASRIGGVHDPGQSEDRVEASPARLAPEELPSSYLANLKRVERLPLNCEGSDKSWVWAAYAYCRTHFRDAEPV
ncbi:MAG: hypothetical protein JNK49_20950 [Planctomycetes bacterium]|nr:hypothetical protein [Planctomycetota bacterium]